MKKILILCLLLLACGYSAYAKVTETKILTHRFENESASSKLHINSSYGNINVTQADQNFIAIQVDLKATARSKDTAMKILDDIKISFSGSGTTCSARTDIKSGSRSSGEGFEITYTVTIPRGSRLDIINKYGNTHTGDLDGTFTADVKYGNINTGNLNGRGNVAEIKYGNMTMGNSPDIKLNLGYSNVRAEDIANLRTDTRYSNVNIGGADKIVINGSSYDSYSVDKVATISSSSGTSGISIGTLVKSIDLPSVKYGNVDIDRVEAEFDKINIHASYASVRINFVNPSFAYELKSKYGDVDLGNIPHDNKVEMRGYTEVKIEGNTGGGTAKKVNITANYGKIQLSQTGR